MTASDAKLHRNVSFPLGLKNYQELRATPLIPRLLFVLVLRRNPAEWMETSEESMISRRFAYWASLLGMKEASNTSKRTETRTQIVLSLIRRSGISWCYAKNSESSTWGLFITSSTDRSGTVEKLGLEHTVRPEGRPRRASWSAADMKSELRASA